ncbi:cell wall elongation/penicillin-binding protein regulator TseB [Bacillus altitudinis]|uniref:cell wall elongation/penicillin-binding protein regulator TseB n=1 Tax=Bacillus altitudinis TaxID=293387 RepID=UPI0024A87686|nr:cell wall elongation/penicillin-binding protein regulator TseB [Bacillus altitudinis]MDI6648272.1 cell wall elongation/penicillin-binding protein regulator TseB [Bacillus altitudinis]MDI6662896.1 cell wall elongation/penicillin-binding protein regulator TseB [Bacillus altitudinis]
MKKIVWIISSVAALVLLIGIISFSWIYQMAMGQKEEGHESAIERAKKQASLAQVEQVDTFVGKEKQFIVEGKNKQNDAIYVWVPASKKEKVIAKKAKEGITSNQAVQAVQKENTISKLKNVQLAREGDVLLWEVTYLNENNQLSFSYVDFTTGRVEKNLTP